MQSVPVSVVIPAYNAERYIGEAIESVKSQSVAIDEIIVVDNNCADDTVKISKDLGATIVREKKQGIAAARNRALRSISNPWIAFLDSDDVWAEKKIELQWNALQRFPEARIVTCDSGWIFEPDKTRKQVPILAKPDFDEYEGTIIGKTYSYTPRFSGRLCEWFFLNSSTIAMHREVFDTVGFYDESLRFAGDMELYGRALAKFGITTVKKNLAYIRRHKNNRTADLSEFTRHKLEVAERFANDPDLYPKGYGEYILELERKIFLEKGRALANKLNRERR